MKRFLSPELDRRKVRQILTLADELPYFVIKVQRHEPCPSAPESAVADQCAPVTLDHAEDRQLESVRKTGFTRTLFGRIRPIPEINATQPAMRGLAERTALNTPVQGTAADLMKLAMIETDRRLTAAGLRARMTLQVHDELVFEVPKEEAGALKQLVRQAMEQVHPLEVPLAVEIKSGPNWRDMEECG